MDVATVRRKQTDPESDQRRVLRALDNVSFEINAGEAVGFLGSNGAGKSTLLKVLSRITPPSSGWAEIRGRVGALLEVGSGFHPELSGRENVFLNGAVLGMSRAEITASFDEIVEFAGVQRFLETPVKRYSSGMYVRLAFSVAAHLLPEVLIVDEVLAVGDAAFQRKCLARMSSIAAQGRTVLFVSHNMSVLQSLCSRGVVLQSGRVIADASIIDASRAYLATLEQVEAVDLLDRTDRRGWQHLILTSVGVHDGSGRAARTGDSAGFTFRFTGLDNVSANPAISLRFHLYDELGQPVATLDSAANAPRDSADGRPEEIVCEVDELPLLPGRYRVDVSLRADGHLQDELQAAAWFNVEDGLLQGRPVGLGALGRTTMPHAWRLPKPA